MFKMRADGYFEKDILVDKERAAGEVDKFLLLDGNLYSEVGSVTDNPIPSVGEVVEVYEVQRLKNFVNRGRELRCFQGMFRVESVNQNLVVCCEEGKFKRTNFRIKDIISGLIELV